MCECSCDDGTDSFFSSVFFKTAIDTFVCVSGFFPVFVAFFATRIFIKNKNLHQINSLSFNSFSNVDTLSMQREQYQEEYYSQSKLDISKQISSMKQSTSSKQHSMLTRENWSLDHSWQHHTYRKKQILAAMSSDVWLTDTNVQNVHSCGKLNHNQWIREHCVLDEECLLEVMVVIDNLYCYWYKQSMRKEDQWNLEFRFSLVRSNGQIRIAKVFERSMSILQESIEYEKEIFNLEISEDIRWSWKMYDLVRTKINSPMWKRTSNVFN